MRAVLVKQPGGAEQLEIGEVQKPALDEVNTLLIRIKATALNRADIHQREGKYPPPPGASEVLGLETAGIVEEVSEAAAAEGWKKGDRICALLPGGGYAEYCAIPHGMAIRIPDGMPFEEAASLPEAFLTAWQALCWQGDLQDNKRVLIHAGASGVGTAAIQLAKQFANTTVIVTAGSDEKIEFCQSVVGADHGINYKQCDGRFAERVLELTEGKGVDILIDFVGASYWEENLRCLACDGVMVMLAFLGGTAAPAFDLSPFLRKRITVRGSTLRARPVEYKTKLTKELAAFLLPRLADGRIKAVISKVFDWKDVAAAHGFMEDNRNLGKIVLTGM
ncbi:putative NAD(P)H quinone oxidoreductase, PIG3 family [Balamuthia mandrillaris]